jgi:hypothetical protein
MHIVVDKKVYEGSQHYLRKRLGYSMACLNERHHKCDGHLYNLKAIRERGQIPKDEEALCKCPCHVSKD